MRKRLPLLAAAAVIAVLLIAALSFTNNRADNFTQDPGFVAYYAANPPADGPPTAAERALLQRYRPRVFLSADNARPISFYDDYIGSGALRAGDGSLISRAATREQLNAVKDDPGATFAYRPGTSPTKPIVFARVDRDTLTEPNGRSGSVERQLTFLTYNLVFGTSGLPAGMPAWVRPLAAATGWAEDWHQLDNFTAATVVLDESGSPLALMVQQHHFVRSYVFGVDIPSPADGGPAIDVAIGSNELYPHQTGRTERRMVGSMTADALEYLVTGEGRPLFTSYDVTDPAIELDYALDFLPPSDAFYVFQGRLGENRRLPGREGPPGADYNSWPAFERRSDQLIAGYWRDGDQDFVPLIREALSQGGFDEKLRTALATRFWRSLSREG